MLAIIVVLLAWYLSRRQGEVVVSEPLRIVPLTAQPGAKAAPRFSPDGRFVAFQWNGTTRDNWDIYVTRVDRGEPLRLTNDPADDASPVWSPDGSEVAFVRRSGEVTSMFPSSVVSRSR